jgi:hypothetical protein
MHHGPTIRGSRAYPIPETAVADLIERLWADGDLKELDAEGRVLLGSAAASATGEPTVVLQMRLSEGVALLSVAPDADAPDGLSIAAAGPVEELLGALGYHPVQRSASLRYEFALDGVKVGVIHTDPAGWSCELTAELVLDDALAAVERRLGLESYALTES